MPHLKNRENMDCFFNKDSVIRGDNITILDLNEEQDTTSLHELRRTVSRNCDEVLPRILSHENLLIPELTIQQNLKFYSDVTYLEKDTENLKAIFLNHLNHKRPDIVENDWQAFAFMLYLKSQSEYLFISSSIIPALNGNFKKDLLLQLKEMNKTIFFSAFPPAIDTYRDFTDFFVINENNTLGEKIRYDEARLKVIEFNQRRDKKE